MENFIFCAVYDVWQGSDYVYENNHSKFPELL